MVLAGSPFVREHPAIQAPEWVKDAVFYQIFPERFANGDTANDPPHTEPWGGKPTTSNYFGGDLQGIIDHLDYISALGCNAIYLNPIFASNSNHKYHTSDYLQIDPEFGDERVLKNLIDSCHARGIRIILDAVFNHTGVDFFAFQDIRRRGADSRYIGWYNIYGLPLGPPSNPNYECWWGLGSLPKLMTENPDVQNYLFDVTRHWMQLGIDGWRLDVPNEIPHDFWVSWRSLVKSLNPNAYIVGEIWGDGSPWLQGDQFDGVMNYRLRAACVDFFALRKASASEFDARLAAQRDSYPPGVNGVLLNLLGSHDTERFLTLCDGNKRALQLALLFLCTYPGAPMIYYGDEVGMQGGKDPACRGTMMWDTRQQDRELLDYVRRVVELRRAFRVLRRGSFATALKEDRAGVYTFARAEGDQKALVVLNNGMRSRRVALPVSTPGSGLAWRQVWPGTRAVRVAAGTITAQVPGYTGAVFIGEKSK